MEVRRQTVDSGTGQKSEWIQGHAGMRGDMVIRHEGWKETTMVFRPVSQQTLKEAASQHHKEQNISIVAVA